MAAGVFWTNDGGGRPNKVARVLETYDIPEVGDELERRWVGDGVEEQSLRALAEWLNARLVAAALRHAGESPVEGEAENLYGLLTDDEVGGGARVEAERKLERAGVDVDGLRDDFVSHTTVHRYLQTHRNASKAESTGDPVANGRDRVERLRTRLTAVTINTVADLRDSGRLDTPPVDTLTTVTVTCERCESSYPADSFFDAGGCDCRD